MRITTAMNNQAIGRDGTVTPPTSPTKQEMLDYWQKALSDFECAPFPALPPSIKQPLLDSVVELQLPRFLGSASDFSASMIIRAAWALTVGRMTNSDDIVFGVKTARDDLPISHVTGSSQTTDTLPVRVKLDSGQKVHEYLDTVHKQALGTIPFENVGLSQIANASTAAQFACAFQTLLMVQREDPSHEQIMPAGTVAPSEPHRDETRALIIQTTLGSEQTVIKAVFDARVIQPWSVNTLLERLGFVIHQLNEAGPNMTVADVDLVTRRDLEQMWEWNGVVPASVENCMHERIEHLAQVQPHAPAVCAWNGELTYKELNRLATSLAGHLVQLGVSTDVLVPLCFEKSMWTPVAMLAVMKAGGGFVLLDSSLPKERLQDIVIQTGANLILSSCANQELSSELASDVVTVSHDFFTGDPARKGARQSTKKVNPTSLAFVIFTSGSTGVPKGAMITHRNVASAFLQKDHLFGCTVDSRVYDFASYSFTVSITNCFMAFSAGGCLCIPSDEDRRIAMPASFSALGANTVILTPSIAATISPERMKGLKLLIFGGEAVHARDSGPWFGRAKLMTALGTSECPTCVTVNSDASNPEELSHIGKGVGAATWVVDPENHNRLLPPGCIGELVVEGPIVGRGYLNNPIKTAAAFITDPPWLTQGAPGHSGRHGRLYKMGDLVHHNQDGSLTYIGRKDTQIKIRGQRVELGDVEHWVKNSIPEASQVIAEVIVPQGNRTKPKLAAFLLMKDVAKTEGLEQYPAKVISVSRDVEKNLMKKLASHMIPTVFFSLHKLPMTATGKTNRRKLREIGASFSNEALLEIQMAEADIKTQPRTEAERQIQRIWAHVLGIDQVKIGLEDSFLRLGGDSITAVRVVGEARKVNLKLTVADILRCSTLHHLATQTSYLATDAIVEIEPFSLLGSADVTSLLKDISSQYQLDADTILDAYPCTQLQEGLLLLSTKRPGDYVMQVTIELSPHVSIPRFHDAWKEVSRATSLFRTRIVQHQEDGLLQVVLDKEFDWIETTGLETYLEIDAKRSMELGQPLIRYALVKDDLQVPRWFVLTAHHALYDGWSMPLIVDALNRAYKGEALDLRPAFQTFVKYCQDQDKEKIAGYWRQSLSEYDTVPFPALPPSIRQPAVDTVSEHQFPRPKIRSLAITESTMVRAAWAIVLGQTTNSDDVVFGVTVSGRSAPVIDVEKLIGPAIATVPIRIKLGSEQRVVDYLRDVQKQATDMIPFEQVGLQNIAKLSPEGKQACQFQTLLVVQPQDSSAIRDEFGTWNLAKQDQWLNTYALTLEIYPGPKNFTVRAFFDSRIIQPWTVDSLLKRLDYAIHQFGQAGLEERLADVRILPQQEINQIWEWNKSIPEPLERCLHDMIADQARASPEALAVDAWDGTLTYGNLDRLSTRLACHLVDIGVKPDAVVPLCFEKSMWVTIAVLAVLKAGAAFCMLDPTHPEDRLRSILQQTGGTVVLSSKAQLSLISRLAASTVLLGPGLIPEDAAIHHNVTLPPSDPSRLLYIVFTSGSTGAPKGVRIPHSSFCSSIHYQARQLGFTPTSRLLEASSHAFDLFVHNTGVTLATGGCLCVPSESDRKDRLMKTIVDMKPSIFLLTPSVARVLDPKQVSSLKTVVLVGEASNEEDVARWWNYTNVINAYGPSECTPHSVINPNPLNPSAATRIGIGAGSVTWVVDPSDHERLAPIGAVGELLLEGPLLGQGYLNDTEKTSKAFVQSPAWLVQGSTQHSGRRNRLYKTGDLVRYNEDGSLSYHGRKDTQVKIRGQRVELGEVEYHFRECMPEAAQAEQIAAEVIIPCDGATSAVLVVFLSEIGPTKPTSIPQSLLAHQNNESHESHVNGMAVPSGVVDKLEQRLPSYMIPTVYFVLSRLPMTVTGKTNRKRLREIGSSFSVQQLAEIQTSSHSERLQPSTEMEKILQQIWARVLRITINTISLDDSFFRLGGDSISAMKLVSTARRAGIQLTVADVFRYPKLMDQARLHTAPVDSLMEEEIAAFSLLGDAVDTTRVIEEAAATCGIAESLIEDIYPCSPLQEGLISLTSKKASDYIIYNTLQLKTGIDKAAFRSAWNQVVRSVPILRTRIVHSTIGLLQVVIAQDIQWEESEDLDAYLAQDKLEPMNLGEPLARFALVSEPQDDKQWFVWTVHHALYDGWSLPQVIEAVRDIYQHQDIALRHNRPGFNTFIKYLSQQDQEAASAYWQSNLAECQATPFPPLPLPSTVRVPDTDATIEYKCELPSEQSSDATTSTLIRAAWAIVTARYTASDDVIFGATVTGRNAPVNSIESIIGPIIATVPVRVRVRNDNTVEAFLEMLQQQATDMIPYEQSGLQRIRKIGLDAQHACDFQTLLIVQPPGDAFNDDQVFGEWHNRSELHDFTTYALTLQCSRSPDGVQTKATFNTQIIDYWQVKKILCQFSFLLQQLVRAGPGVKITDLSILPPEDQQDLQKWNSEIPSVDRCIHHLFTERAGLQHRAPAICAWDGEMTYGELDELSNRLAYHLVTEYGVASGNVVTLCFEKSMWTVVAILAVLKAGGAFLLLDPSFPFARLQLVCCKASSTFVLTSQALFSVVNGLTECILVVNRDLMLQISQPGPVHVTVQSTDTAYIIFTSGSTGEPKGCKIDHSASCSALINHGHHVGMNTNTRTLQFGSYSFAGALAEILLTIVHGGCICIPSEEERRSGLTQVISKMNMNWAFLTSTVLDLIDPQSVPSLRTLCVGGEPIRKSQITQWGSRTHLRQTYGSSETSGFVSSTHITNLSAAKNVGKASTGVYWIVDSHDHNKLAPIGAIGEILVEGAVLGREYVGEAEKTISTFIEPPAWIAMFKRIKTKPRFYKTGDLARYKADGSIQLLGRKDTQVKLRGQRIELGEVEHQARLANTDIKDLAVDIITSESTETSILACFIVPQSGIDLSPQGSSQSEANIRKDIRTIREALEKFLPQYMIPAVFIPIKQLPLTLSKKIDRRRLREIGASFSVEQLAEMRTWSQGQRSPLTEIEQMLQKLWARVLHLKPNSIGPDDNFFWLGGDSISAMKLVGEARKNKIQLTVANIFENPKLVDQASQITARVDTIIEEIAAFSLLGSDTAKILEEAAGTCGIEESLIEDIYPCSPLQEGLISLTSKKSGDYIMQAILELHTDVDEAAFRDAWNQVVQSIAILRTRIVQGGKYGLLQIVTTREIEWAEAENLDAYLTRDKSSSMDLGEPLTRFALVNENHKRWFVWTVHHALYDGWSLPQVVQSVREAYRNRGRALEKRPGFNTFIKYLSQQNQEAASLYWRTTLAECQATPFPSLPSTVQVPVADTTIEYKCQALLGRSSTITTSTLIRAAWAVVTSRYTTDDVVFGSTVTGRNAPVAGIEAIIGPTFATVPVRVRVKSDDTVSVFLTTLQQQGTEMIPYEQSGLQQIKKMGPDAQRACDFQTLLIVQPANDENVLEDKKIFNEWGGRSELRDFTTYGLMLQCTVGHNGSGLNITASFDTRVIKHWRLKKVLGQFDFVLQQLTGAPPHLKIADINLLRAEDRQELWQWNSAIPEAADHCIHDLFIERAAAQPNAPAIHAWDGEMTYGELNKLSDRLARRLVEVGVRSEVFVPLCFEKSIWTSVAMLAVLKAGGAFVLLDPTQPISRLDTIVKQTAAQLILCSLDKIEMVRQFDRPVITVGCHLPEAADLAFYRALPRVTPSTVAYAVFTSGSTGTPKGVVMQHAGFCSALHYQTDRLGFTVGCRVFDFASYSFDIAVHNALATLLAGGCLCVPSEDERKGNIAQAMTKMKITVADLTPSVARLIEPTCVPTLKTLILAGEAVSYSDVSRWDKNVVVINAYGPAECAPMATINVYSGDPTAATVIGKGAGVLTWVVDPMNHDVLLAAGETGELLLEGPLLARGYLDNPEKTAAVFIENPTWLMKGLSEKPGRSGRLYKTGDLVQYNEDGSLTFLGRKDTQVKIRGQRVELGEVEHHTKQCMPFVEQMAAEAILPQGSETSILAAFLQLTTEGNKLLIGRETDHNSAAQVVFPTEVRKKLMTTLPGYMVPDIFFSMSHLPMTASGKIDRKQLREVGASFSIHELAEMRTLSQEPKRRPSSEAERTLQNLWARVLNINADIIGLDDSFFELGGDSITAMKLVGEARKDKIQLAVADVFQNPHLTDLCRLVRVASSTAAKEITPFSLLPLTTKAEIFAQLHRFDPTIPAKKVVDILPATSFQSIYVMDGIKLPRQAFNYYFIDLGFGIDVTRFEASCRALFDYFPILRTQFASFQEKMWQIVLHDTELPYRIFNVEGPLPEESHAICMQDVEQISPLELPTSFMLVKNLSQESRLIFRLSHAQYDGVCIPVMLKALVSLYRQESFTPSQSYASYIAHSLNRQTVSSQYWRQLLEGSHLTRIRPCAKAKADKILRKVEANCFISTPELPNGITLASLISAAWGVVLSHITGDEDVVYGHVVAGRNSNIPGVEEIVGPCVNFIPVRAHTSSNSTSGTLLHSIQKQYVSLGESDSMGWDDIVQHCTDWPTGSMFDSLVHHQNIDEHPEVQFQEVPFKIDWFDNPYLVFHHVHVLSRPRGDKLQIIIISNTDISTVKSTNALLNMLSETILKLAAGLDTPFDLCRPSISTITWSEE